jgi:outer membrane protein assembly factor BamB
MSMLDRKRVLGVLVGLVLCTALLSAQEWPQWRGPARTGAAAGFTAPAAWPDRPKQIWKVQAGAGHASPVVASGRVYLFSRMGEQEAVSARDLGTGKEIWRAAYDARSDESAATSRQGRSRPPPDVAGSSPWHQRNPLALAGAGRAPRVAP